jgi:hypothetical protein
MGQPSSFDDLLSGKSKSRGKTGEHKSHFVELPRCLPPARVAFWSGHYNFFAGRQDKRGEKFMKLSMKLFKRIFSPVLALSVLAVAVPTSVFAAETNTVSQLNPSVAKVNTVSPKVETQGVKTAALQKAVLKLADMLESQAIKKLLDFVEDYGSKKVADTIRKYADDIADTLRTIASWKDLSIKIIQDQVSGVLYDLGVPLSTARQVGWVISKFVDWVLL